MTNEKSCLLHTYCQLAGDPVSCTSRCPFFVNLYGSSGDKGIVKNANVPRDYRMLTLSTSPARDAVVKIVKDDGKVLVDKKGNAEQPILDILVGYAKTFTRQFEDGANAIRSLYLYSEQPGTGKTTTAAALANEYLIRHYLGSKKRKLQPHNRPVYFLSMNRWHAKFHEFNRRNVPEHIGEPAAAEYYDMHNFAKHAPFLVIDDIGVREASDAFNMDVLDLVDHRVANRLPTVYTSNVPVESLKHIYDSRVFDRVRDLCMILEFVGDSHRGLYGRG
jgi:DNA replication protein DnaC